MGARKIKWDNTGTCLVSSCVIIISLSLTVPWECSPFFCFLCTPLVTMAPALPLYSQHNLSKVPCWSCLNAHFWLHCCLFWFKREKPGTLAGATWSTEGAWQLHPQALKDPSTLLHLEPFWNHLLAPSPVCFALWTLLLLLCEQWRPLPLPRLRLCFTLFSFAFWEDFRRYVHFICRCPGMYLLTQMGREKWEAWVWNWL